MFSVKIGGDLINRTHFPLITSIDDKNIGFANPGS
jgi:hypothetical protein